MRPRSPSGRVKKRPLHLNYGGSWAKFSGLWPMPPHDAIPDETQGIGAIEAEDLLRTFREFAETRLNRRERLIVSWLHPQVLSFQDDPEAAPQRTDHRSISTPEPALMTPAPALTSLPTP